MSPCMPADQPGGLTPCRDMRRKTKRVSEWGSMSKKFRVGLVGCGGMGNEHLKILARRPDVQIVGVCDERSERAIRMGVEHSAAFWTDYAAFVKEAGLDVVHICSPSGYHGDHGLL